MHQRRPPRRPRPPPAPAPFRGPCADSPLGELFLDVIGLVAARGYAAEVSQCRALCGLTWRRGDLGATNDMIVSSLRLQCGAVAAREAVRESFTSVDAWGLLQMFEGSTQLIRASMLNNLPRVLLARGAKQVRPGKTYTAMHLAVHRNHIEVVKLLLAAPGASDALKTTQYGSTPLKRAIDRGHAKIKALLRAAGAPEEVPLDIE